jgi:hypothetical protein
MIGFPLSGHRHAYKCSLINIPTIESHDERPRMYNVFIITELRDRGEQTWFVWFVDRILHVLDQENVLRKQATVLLFAYHC